jgi:hypothetical protein
MAHNFYPLLTKLVDFRRRNYRRSRRESVAPKPHPSRNCAQLAEVSVSTLIRFEAGGWGDIQGSAKTINRVLAVLEAKGVIFRELGVELIKKPRR